MTWDDFKRTIDAWLEKYGKPQDVEIRYIDISMDCYPNEVKIAMRHEALEISE